MELVYLEDLTDELDRLCDDVCIVNRPNRYKLCSTCKIGQVYTIAESLESVYVMSEENLDLVNVVRCKDCKYFHRRQTMFGKEYTECDAFNQFNPNENGYCSRGVKRNHEENQE